MSLVESFKTLLGPVGVVTDSHALAPCLFDPITGSRGEAIALLRPASTAQAAAVVAFCHSRGIAVTPRGGGTGFAAGAIPTQPTGVLLSVDRMRQIREVDPVSATVTVDAGITIAELNETLQENNLSFPVRHGGDGSAQVGGTISTNAGGYNVVRHGMTRPHVLGLEVVLPDGRVWNGLRKLRKDNTGYDLKQLFIGGEGTLGLITGAVLRLSPRAARKATALVAVESPEKALEIHVRLHRELGEILTASEIFSARALEIGMRKVPGQKVPFTPLPAWMHLVELETSLPGFDAEEALGSVLFEAIEDGLGCDALVARSQAQRDAFWMYRESLAVAQAESELVLKSDTAVPVSCVARFIECASAAISEILPEAVPLPFGHLGDGNIHFNVLAPAGLGKEAFARQKPKLTEVIEAISVDLGGTVSAEHGIGSSKRKALWNMRSEVEHDLMRAVGKAIGPVGLFNEGKIL